MTVTLHSAISGRPLQTLVADQGAGADTILLAANPRVAFLHVDAEALEWDLRLDERVDGEPEGEQR